jgi:CRISPR-associated protein Cmr2
MNNTTFWQRKIQALLHDPPNKALNIKGHEAEAQAWAQKLGIGKLNDKDFKPADWIASAADRLNFPSYWSIGGANFRNKPYLTHPLTGKKLNLGGGRFLPTQINEDWLRTAMQTSIDQIPDAIKADQQKLFLWLWRNWSSEIQAAEGNQLGALWDLLPADTRIPDHSIWAHQSLTSAIAATADSKGDPDPAFLLFTIGPVQAFISAARRTQDLWAGSYLLSYLNWQAIQVIAEEIGPDAVIFPNLIGQPLCDRWLQSKGVFTGDINPEDLILPSLPNRFLAIVPASQGKELAQKAAKAVKKAWYEISNAVRTDLESLFPNGQKPQWQETWKRQIESNFDTYWQVYPWRPQGHSIQDIDYKFLDPHKPFLGDRLTKIDEILKIYAKQEKEGGGQYAPNIGAIYSDLYFITEKALGSRKALRNFKQVPEQGDKSTLGGDRAALHDRVDKVGLISDDFDRKSSDSTRVSRESIRDFWRDLAHKLQKKGRWEIQENGQERLDAIELTKRCAWRSYLQTHLDVLPQTFDAIDEDNLEESYKDLLYQLKFPSTSNITVASFKLAIIQKATGERANTLRQALQNWKKAVLHSPMIKGNRVLPDVIPYLPTLVSPNDLLLNSFLKLDGRLLFEETYLEEARKPVSSEHQKSIEKARETLKKFLSIASSEEYKIAKPRKYFAVLMMDGDNMGSWISGEKMPEYRKLLHPDTQKKLETDPTYKEIWEPILGNPRLMSPAIHGFISKALGDFSLKLVRHIVEERYAGKLVYAGGDDVMALLPLDCALEVARELRAAFSGELTTDDQGEKLEVDFAAKESQASKSGYVLLKRPDRERELLTTMGSEATASTGIVIAHHTQPLDLTLQEVRKAEKAAKSAGRNSFSLTFLKRSGEIMSASAKWLYKEEFVNLFINTARYSNQSENDFLTEQSSNCIDTIQVLQEFKTAFANKQISGSFPYELRSESQRLANLESEEIFSSEIKRILLRKRGEANLSPEERKNLAEDLSKKLAHLASNADLLNKSKLVMLALCFSLSLDLLPTIRNIFLKQVVSIKPSEKLKTFADLLVFTRFLATGEGEE